MEVDHLGEAEKLLAAKLLTRELPLEAGVKLLYKPSGAVGSRDSAHGVFFVGGEQPGTDLAVKRFRSEWSAKNELSNLQEARHRGFRTLDVVGNSVYSLGDLGHALVTKKLARFQTMNQIGWQDHFVSDPEYKDKAELLQSMSRFAGKMHKAGIVHKDLQLKNIAQIPPGKFVLFDLEAAQFFDPQAEDRFTFEGACAEDLGDMVGSLVTHGYLHTSTNATFAQEVANNVIQPYLEANPSEAVLEQMDMILDNALVKREQVSRQNIVGAAAGLAVAHA
jgi:tRNA A-37 threonylcarbamoyl transferase component Bud32